MGCIDALRIPLPTLGGGLDVSVPLPAVNLDAALCCKRFSFDEVPSPAGFGVPIPPGAMNVITTQIKIVQKYLDEVAAATKCPVE
jgi:hypothetical protein